VAALALAIEVELPVLVEGNRRILPGFGILSRVTVNLPRSAGGLSRPCVQYWAKAGSLGDDVPRNI